MVMAGMRHATVRNTIRNILLAPVHVAQLSAAS